MSLQLIPQEDWILLEEVRETVSKSIELPKGFKDTTKSVMGYRVLDAGRGYYHESGKFIESQLRKGDIVILDAPMVARFRLQEQEFIAAKERNVAFKVKGV